MARSLAEAMHGSRISRVRIRRARGVPAVVLVPLLALTTIIAGLLWMDARDGPADLVLVQRIDLFTLDPQRMTFTQDIRAARALHEGLVALSPDDCTIVPAVAESWTVSEDRLAWTFRIRDDAKWSNGEPVVAADFAAAWMRGLLPDTAAGYSGFLLHIDGAPEFFRWRSEALARFAAGGREDATDADELLQLTNERFRELVAIDATNDREISVRLRQPLPYFLDLLTFPVFAPVHRATLASATRVDAESGILRTDHRWTRPERLISNGPYVLQRWRFKRDFRLTRNEHYWNRAQVRSATIAGIVIEDANTTVLAYEAGGIDWVTDVLVEYRADLIEQRRRYELRHATELARLRATGLGVDEAMALLPEPDRRRGERRDVRVLDAFGTDFFNFNCRPRLADGRANPFHDAGVRRAFALAVDKQLLVEQVTRLNERVSGSLVPVDSIAGYRPPDGLGFDPARARAELAAAGWSRSEPGARLTGAEGESFPVVEILYSSGNPRFEDLSLALRDMWQRELGVAVDLRKTEAKIFKDELRRGAFMVARGGWYGDYGDPTTFLDLCRIDDGNNDRGYANPLYDAMLDAAAMERDPDARLRLLEEAERFLMEEELPLLPICTYVQVYMYRPDELRGLSEHPRLEQWPGRMWVERE